MGLVRLGISTPSATTATTLFTSDNQYLVSVIATNKSASVAANIRIWVQPSGSSTDAEYAYMIYDLPIDASNSYETFRFAVNSGDLIRVYASTANISFSAYGLVQYDVKVGAGISSYSPTAPSNPVNGMIWVDSDGVIAGSASKPTYAYDATLASWVSMAAVEKVVPYSSTQPVTAVQGDLWVDSTFATSPQLKAYSGSEWVAVGSATDSDQNIIAGQVFR